MSASRDLYNSYIKFCQFRSDALETKKLDLSAVKWFYPTSLLPLGVFIKQNQDINVVPPKDPSVLNYYNIITKGEEPDKNKSYIPIIKMPMARSEYGAKLNKLNIFADDCGGVMPLQFFLDELVDNIYQHSSFSTAYVMAQKYQYPGSLEFCITDNGISIPKSYENNRTQIDNDKDALDMALEGISTKKNEKLRGHGLRSSIRLLTEGMHGECLIVSRGGALCASPDRKTSSSIDEKHVYNGTLICINEPLQTKKVDLYAHIYQ